MTEPTDYEPTEAELPGLGAPARGETPLKLAARRSIVQLQALGYLDERHAVVCQLVLDLADVIAAASRKGQAAAAGMASAQLLAAFTLLLPDPTTGGSGDEWDQFVADLRRSATEARDAAEPSAQE